MSEKVPSDSPDPQRSAEDGRENPLEHVPGLTRIYASAWWHTAEAAVDASRRATSRIVKAAISGESPTSLARDAGGEARRYAREILGIIDPGSASAARASAASSQSTIGEGDAESLRDQGAELLRRSADVEFDEDTHPAYERILGELSPDEGRILRLLATQGAQPSVDIRAGWPLVSGLVAPGRNMIGAEAACRHPERIYAYLNNLHRLGLIWFSRERIKDTSRYAVLEAQPEVIEAMRKGGRTARSVRRSILLTAFGRDFCDQALPLESAPDPEAAAESAALSEPETAEPG